MKIMKYCFTSFVIQLQNSLLLASRDPSFKWLREEISPFKGKKDLPGAVSAHRCSHTDRFRSHRAGVLVEVLLVVFLVLIPSPKALAANCCQRDFGLIQCSYYHV